MVIYIYRTGGGYEHHLKNDGYPYIGRFKGIEMGGTTC